MTRCSAIVRARSFEIEMRDASEAAKKAAPTQEENRRFFHDIFDRIGLAVYDIGGAVVDTNVWSRL